MANAKLNAPKRARRLPAALLVLLVCAGVLRFGLALVTEGYSTDVACLLHGPSGWRIWGRASFIPRIILRTIHPATCWCSGYWAAWANFWAWM